MIGTAPICMFCKHFHKDSNKLDCDAFPVVIPDSIIFSSVDHHNSVDGDNGIQFELIEGAKEPNNFTTRQPSKLISIKKQGKFGGKAKVRLKTPTDEDLPVITIDSVENDDWMKSLPGYKNEVAIHEELAKKYAADSSSK